jgi:hypothetical protein
VDWRSKRGGRVRTSGALRALPLGISAGERGPLHQPFENITLKSIRADLKRPSVGLTLFLIGFQGMYFVPLLYPYTFFEPPPASAFRYYYLSWLLICAGGALETLDGGLWWIRGKIAWASVLLAALAIITTKSITEGESLLSISNKCLPFYWLLLVPAVGLKARNWPWLWLSFLFQTPFGIVYSSHAFMARGATTRLAVLQMEGQNFLGICLYMAPFMFLMLPVFRDKGLRAFALFLFSLENLRCFFLSNRYTFFLLPVEILMVVYATFRSRGTLIVFQRFFMKAILAAVVLVPLSLAAAQSQLVSKLVPTFGEAYEGLIQRMGEGSVHDTIAFDNRWLELKVVSGSMEGMDWVLGKGLAARWSDPFYADWEERYMVHNTWLNSLYWGGVLLFLAVSWPLVWAIRLAFRSQSKARICAAMYIILMFMKFPAYLITFATQEWILFCLALGIVVWSDPTSTRDKIRAVQR